MHDNLSFNPLYRPPSMLILDIMQGGQEVTVLFLIGQTYSPSQAPRLLTVFVAKHPDALNSSW